MKRIKLLVTAAGLFALGVAGVWSTSAAASSFASGDHLRVASAETIDGSYFAAGDTVTIDGTVDGDVYCAGSTITITGLVTGDVLCAGQTVTMSGIVNGSVRAAGETVSLSGQVKGSLTAIGATVTTSHDFKLGKDATVISSTASLDGAYARDLVVTGGMTQLHGLVNRNFTLQGEQLTFGKDGRVAGNLDYTSAQQMAIDKSHIVGAVTYHEADNSSSKRIQSFPAILTTILMSVAMMILYPLLVPRLAHRITQMGRSDMFYTVLIGIGVLIGLPIAAVAVMLTVVGIPLGFVLLLSMMLIVVLGMAQGAVWLGRLVLGSATSNILLQTLGGALVLSIAMQIPVLNVLVGIAWVVIGSGLVARYTATALFVRPDYTVADDPSPKVKPKQSRPSV